MTKRTKRDRDTTATVTVGGDAVSGSPDVHAEQAVTQEAVRVHVSMTVNGRARAMTVEPRTTLLDRCLFILLLYTLPLIWRLGKDLTVWTYVLGILPAMSGTFTSFTRFESTAFPMFIALAVFFTGSKRKWPLIVFVALGAVLHGILLWRFVNFRWAG